MSQVLWDLGKILSKKIVKRTSDIRLPIILLLVAIDNIPYTYKSFIYPYLKICGVHKIVC
jgi:uncharacterized membrane protein YwzB